MVVVAGPQDPGGWAPLEPQPDDDGWRGATAPPPSDYPPPPPGFGAPVRPKGGDARTGPLPLHPMSVGDVLDGSFKLLKANAKTILLVVGAIVVPVQLVSAFAVRETVSVGFLSIMNDPTLLEDNQAVVGTGNLVLSLVTALLGFLTAPIVAGAVSRVVAASYLGEEMPPARALSITFRRLGPLLAASLLVFLAEIIGLLMCVLPAIALFALYTAVTPALMIEEIGPIQSMRRSWRLMRPRFWGVLGIAVLARLIAGFLGNLLGGIPSVAATLLGGNLAWLFIAIGSVLSSLVSAPLLAIVSTLLYFDGRIRNEGFDLQVMAVDLARWSSR